MNIGAFNRAAWDDQVAKGNMWTVPVSSEVIAAARRGDWSVVLTPQKPVPWSWFGDRFINTYAATLAIKP